MHNGRPGIHQQLLQWIVPILLLLTVASCSVKTYPHKTPFVYETNINLEGKFNKEEKSDIESRLGSQLHDSLRARTVRKFLFFDVLRNPPVYDSVYADQTVLYMRALLNSLGYFRDTIYYDTTVNIPRSNPDQYRTTVNFTVIPGKLTKLDSISWNLRDSTYPVKTEILQKLADSSKAESFLVEGKAFAKPVVSAELTRLVDLYRNNGYYRFSFDNLVAVWDTVDAALLRPTVDPFEQIRQLEEIRRRRENPTADLEVMLRPGIDSSALTRYYIGNVTVYPDFTDDTALYQRKLAYPDSNFKVVYFRNIFKPRLLPENVYFRHGQLYSQREQVRTINRFNAMGAWRLVNVEQFPRAGTDTIDFIVRLSPADKYSFSLDVEGSFNNSFLAGNLFGVGINLGLLNRNFARASNQANTNFRFGTELGIGSGQNLVQTRQFSLGHAIYFPRVIPRFVSRFIQKFQFIPDRLPDNFRTIFSFNIATTDRLQLFNLNSVNASWGYEMNWKNTLWSLRIPNVEYSLLNEKDSLQKLILNNPSLAYIFNEGLVISVIPSLTMTGGKRNVVNTLRISLEESGLFSGMIRNRFLDSNLYRFLKINADATRTVELGNSALAFRLFLGAGYPFSRHPDKNRSLPFFKQYFAGGPNSMRAWPLRRLGPGSTVRFYSNDPLRFGDVQFEANAEYRFQVADIAGVKLHSALYTDIGNVWFIKDIPDYPEGTFRMKNFLRDLGVGVGTGLRIDFGLFLLRLDYAFKARDPSPEPDEIESQYKWFYGWTWDKLIRGSLQIGINYPF